MVIQFLLAKTFEMYKNNPRQIVSDLFLPLMWKIKNKITWLHKCAHILTWFQTLFAFNTDVRIFE